MSGPEDVMKMPALGRPFRLGMLYNCYKDALLLEHSLIDSKMCAARTEQIKQAISIQEQIPSDTIRKRAAALGIGPSLLTSLLCGLFEVDGCAKYLLSAKAFRHPGILTYRSLAMERLEKLDLNDVESEHLSYPKTGKCAATHVVTGVWYGDQAIWDCGQEVPASEKVHKNARGTDVQKVACPEQGKTPSKTIKPLLGESEENNAPIKISLYPLRNLELKVQCSNFIHEIRDTLNSEIVEGPVLETEARGK
ncbi:neoverrucotoxin subunit beta-like [Sceloporus undulatus]|uniref:neoverrucotoxin subunit beta-like n=1 Tax=Sceloporus undulatus TaxID=8520 RepID=UPI001C4CDDBA|nr:neoverrucotoxin subunit beta-like [Sceloporus undulatus]